MAAQVLSYVDSSSRAVLPAASTSCGWGGRSLSSEASQTLATAKRSGSRVSTDGE
ncbi:hypothetical protein [Streptomyces sp. NPDC003710]